MKGPYISSRGVRLAFLNRSRFDIIADILEKAVPGAKKTWLLYSANLSFGQHQKYLKTLIGLGLMARQGDIYTTTAKGRDFLEGHGRLMEILGEADGAETEKKETNKMGAVASGTVH